MASKAKAIFPDRFKISVVADTGYYNMKEIINAIDRVQPIYTYMSDVPEVGMEWVLKCLK